MQVEINSFNNVPPANLTAEDVMLHKLGVMKTIYVPVHPYVNHVKHKLAETLHENISMFSCPHKRVQDHMHEDFFSTYIAWAEQAVTICPKTFKFKYPTSGSNEAIRESIAQHGNRERALGKSPKIHIFKGEYEGYKAHAKSHGIEVQEHDRDNYEVSISDQLTTGEPFYLSSPSGIDGNIWKGYESFLQFLEEYCPRARLMVDLAYLNTTKTTPQIRVDSDVIEAIFISMSKSFPGTYYDRVGGMFSKKEYPGLFGNIWFKNLPGLLLGKNLMENSALGEIPTEMSFIQQDIVKKLQQIVGEDLLASDVTFVATQPKPEIPNDIQKILLRNNIVRYCLTPAIYDELNK